MKSRKHLLKHQYQSTTDNCSQTALSVILSQHDGSYTAEEITKHVPVGTYNDEETGDRLSKSYSVDELKKLNKRNKK